MKLAACDNTRIITELQEFYKGIFSLISASDIKYGIVKVHQVYSFILPFLTIAYTGLIFHKMKQSISVLSIVFIIIIFMYINILLYFALCRT